MSKSEKVLPREPTSEQVAKLLLLDLFIAFRDAPDDPASSGYYIGKMRYRGIHWLEDTASNYWTHPYKTFEEAFEKGLNPPADYRWRLTPYALDTARRYFSKWWPNYGS